MSKRLNRNNIEDYIPKDYAQIRGSTCESQWLKTVQDKLDAMEDLEVWKPVIRTNEIKTIDTRWVLSVKMG